MVRATCDLAVVTVVGSIPGQAAIGLSTQPSIPPGR